MLQYHSNLPPTHSTSIKKINHSLIKSQHRLSKDLPKRSKSNAHSFSTSKKQHNCPSGKNYLNKSTNSFSKQLERSKDFHHLNHSLNFKAYDSNHSFNSSHMNISFINNKNHHSESSSNLITKDKAKNKSKEKTIQGMKSNYSQDKMKLKKVLTVKVNQNYSLSNEISKKNHDQDKAITIEDKIHQSVLARIKRDQPLKLYTEGNTNHHSPNPNESTTMVNASNSVFHHDKNHTTTTTTDNRNDTVNGDSSSVDMINAFNDLDHKLLMKLSQNKTNSKTKKYNSLRATFEEMIKVFPEQQRFLLEKLYTGYHDVVLSFANENKSLKETNAEMQNRLFNLDKTHIETNNKLKEKDKELEVLRRKISEYERNQGVFSQSTNMSTQMNPPISSNEVEIYTLDTETNKNNNHITDINKRNLGDLDALYFLDRVQMNSTNSHHAIPVLNLQEEEEEYHQRKKENITKGLYSNILGKYKNNSNPTMINAKKNK